MKFAREIRGKEETECKENVTRKKKGNKIDFSKLLIFTKILI